MGKHATPPEPTPDTLTLALHIDELGLVIEGLAELNKRTEAELVKNRDLGKFFEDHKGGEDIAARYQKHAAANRAAVITGTELHERLYHAHLLAAATRNRRLLAEREATR